MLAAVHYEGGIVKSFTHLPGEPPITVNQVGSGLVQLDFGTDMRDRYIVITEANGASGNAYGAEVQSGNPEWVNVQAPMGTLRFYLLVY